MHILLADGQLRVRSALRLLLEQQPETYVVEEATNTQELLDCVKNCYPDILLLDWKLPGLVPDELSTTLRTLNPGLFIIVLDSIPHTRQAAIKAGANEFVSKNDPPECLMSVIKSYMASDVRKKGGNRNEKGNNSSMHPNPLVSRSHGMF